MADIGEVPSPALVVRATPKEMQMRPAAQQRYCRRRLRIMHQGSDAGYLRVSYELSRNPPDTPTTATMNPMVRRMIMIRVSGLLIEDMRTAVCIRFCVAAKEGGAGGREKRRSKSRRGSVPGMEMKRERNRGSGACCRRERSVSELPGGRTRAESSGEERGGGGNRPGVGEEEGKEQGGGACCRRERSVSELPGGRTRAGTGRGVGEGGK